tara:strand:- start:1214 stop:1801 length:588 start_codon:yes stop_codon:yes gene_type:complete
MRPDHNSPIYIVGNARHGKTTVATLLAGILDCGYADSSLFMADKVVRPYLAEKYDLHYTSAEHAHADRGGYRKDWRDAIMLYNQADPAKLSSAIFAENRIYCGCRSELEYAAGRERHGAFGLYVDAFDRLGTTEDTFDIPAHSCDAVLDNNGAWCDTVNRLMTIVANYNLDGSHSTAGRRGAGVLPPTTGEGYDQ